jgi:hypothetical protein
MSIQEFIKDNTITDNDTILTALCMPESARGVFKVKPLIPTGVGVFKGDKLPGAWSANDQLECGAVYPLYSNEGDFVIGKDGKGLKIVESAWKELMWF